MQSYPLGVCKSLSDVLSFSQSPGLSHSCWRCWAVCCYGWDAASGSAAGCRGARCFTGTRESGRRRSVRCAAAATDWWGAPIIWCKRATGGKSFVVPVEVKSRARPAQPYASHILQLATYCLLVEENFEAAPPYGLLRYADATLQIPYTDELRRRVLDTAAEIRQARRAPDVRRSHSEPQRCTACGYRSACGPEALN